MRKGLALGLALLLLLGLTGCAGKQEPEKDGASIVVGFSQLGAESSWRIANTASMEQAAKDFGYGLMMENANQKQEKQIDAIRSFIAYCWMNMPMDFWLLRHPALWAVSRADLSAGSNSAARIAMIAITIRSSINVKDRDGCFIVGLPYDMGLGRFTTVPRTIVLRHGGPEHCLPGMK